MKNKTNTFPAIILVLLMHYNPEGLLRSSKQPYPESGFWVTESTPDEKYTIVKYYDHERNLISEKKEDGYLNISKLSVRKYLNKNLIMELSKDKSNLRSSL